MLNPNFWQWMSLFHSPEQITLPVNNIPVKKEENDVFYSVNVPTNRGIEQEVSID